MLEYIFYFFFFSSRRRHTRYIGDWSSDVCSSDLFREVAIQVEPPSWGRTLVPGNTDGIVVLASEVVAQGVYHFGLAVTELRARNQTEPFEEIDNEKYGGRIGVRKTGTEAQSIHKERTGPGEELVIPPRLVQRTFSGAHRVSRGVKGLGKGLPALGILEKDIGRFQVSIRRKMPGKPADVAHFQNHIVLEIALNGEVGGVIPALFMGRVVGYRKQLKPWLRGGGQNNTQWQVTANGQSHGAILP